MINEAVAYAVEPPMSPDPSWTQSRPRYVAVLSAFSAFQ